MKYWLSLVFICAGLYLFSYSFGSLATGSQVFIFEASIGALILLSASFIYLKSDSIIISAICLIIGLVEISAILVNLATMLDYLYSGSWLGSSLTWYYDTYETWMGALAGIEAAALLIYPIFGALNGLYRASLAIYSYISDYLSFTTEAILIRCLGFIPHQTAVINMQAMRES